MKPFRVVVPENRLVQFPDDVPVGSAEIVLVTSDIPTPEQIVARVDASKRIRTQGPTLTMDTTDYIREGRNR